MSANTQLNEPPLDWPWYGIGPVDAVKRVFKKYATFTGRASRGEYWWFVLAYAVVVVVLYGIITAVVVASSGSASATGSTTPGLGVGTSLLSSLFGVFYLATLVPYLAVAVRRLHDAGHSGWMILLGLIPLVGGIILLVLLVGQTSPAAEQYGPPRSQGAPGYGVPGYGAPGYGQAYPPA